MNAACPRCERRISTHGGRYALHGITTDSAQHCPMSKQATPVTGTAPIDYYRRANLVCDLASQVQDEDTSVVWDYLTALSAEELQRLLMVALAAIDVNAPMERIYGWVLELPAARQGRRSA